MNREILYVADDTRIKSLEKRIELLTGIIEDFIQEKQSLGDWISEEQAVKLTGLGKSKLYALRNEGKVRSSTLTDRKIYYRRDDFTLLLDKNQK